MMSIPMNQSPKDQFLHWHQDMDKSKRNSKTDEIGARPTKRLRCKNDLLWAQNEKSRDLGKDMQDSGHDAQSITRDKGKGAHSS